MSEDDRPAELPQPLDYAGPRDAQARARSVRKGLVRGIIATVLGVPLCAMLGSWLDQRWNPNVELAGLAGLFIGGIAGLSLLAIAAVVALVLGRRRDHPVLRGVAIGIFITIGVAAIALGVCAVGM